MLFSKFDQGIGSIPVELVLQGLDFFPFHDILGRQRVELLLRQSHGRRVTAHDLVTIDGGADEEIIGECLAQRGFERLADSGL